MSAFIAFMVLVKLLRSALLLIVEFMLFISAFRELVMVTRSTLVLVMVVFRLVMSAFIVLVMFMRSALFLLIVEFRLLMSVFKLLFDGDGMEISKILEI